MMNSQRLSPVSDEVPMDDKKRKRMISNRESARRSRMRKQQQQEELISQVTKLQSENTEINQRISVASQMYVAVDSDNKVLRAQLMELTDRLRSLNSVLQIVEEVSGLALDIPEIPDALMEPWQLPCPGQSIMANSDVFQF